jgi:hypothetical protein
LSNPVHWNLLDWMIRIFAAITISPGDHLLPTVISSKCLVIGFNS